jgi:hypothetical protein
MLTFSLSLALGYETAYGSPAALGGLISNYLNQWSLFQNSQLELQNVSVASDWSSLQISFMVGPNITTNAAVFTYGGVASTIATQINSAVPGVTVTPQGLGAGLGPTSVAAQFADVGGLSLNPVSSTNLQTDLNAIANLFGGGGGGSTPNPSGVPTWFWLGAAGMGVVALILLVK